MDSLKLQVILTPSIFFSASNILDILKILNILGKVSCPLPLGYVEKPIVSYILIKGETFILLDDTHRL